MRDRLLLFLALLLCLPVLFAAEPPPDVHLLWQPAPHPSIPLRQPVLTSTASPSTAPPEGAPNVVLITIDTWRADRLNLYGSPRPNSDFLNEMAKDSIVFDRAISPSSWTWPTMVSLASGMSPRAHGAIKDDAPMCEEITTFAEVMHGAGWRTGFIGANTYFEPVEAGYRQGFEFFFASGDEGARRMLEYVAYFLDPIYGQPFFLHTHFMDPHCPYQPDEKSLRAMQDVPFGPTDSSDEEIGPLGWDNMAHPCHAVPPMESGAPLDEHPLASKASRYLDAYDAGLHQMDGDLRLLKQTLQASSAWDNSWVIITGDHGEEFGEHGRIGHGEKVYAETTWVPLIIRPPGGLTDGGRRIATPISLVDVPKSIVSAIGLTPPDSWTGRDLAAVLQGAVMQPAPVISETLYRNDSWQALLHLEDKRLLVGGLLPIAEVYSADDPMDRRNLLLQPQTDRMRIETVMMAGLLRAELRAQSAASICDVGTMELDPAHWEKLKALGYTDEVAPANRIRPLLNPAPDSPRDDATLQAP
jgi:arylsulfatase A-like enzyme